MTTTRITDASPQTVVVSNSRGERQAYRRTAVGWRRRTERLHDAGELVTDPALHALLESAAARAK